MILPSELAGHMREFLPGLPITAGGQVMTPGEWKSIHVHLLLSNEGEVLTQLLAMAGISSADGGTVQYSLFGSVPFSDVAVTSVFMTLNTVILKTTFGVQPAPLPSLGALLTLLLT